MYLYHSILYYDDLVLSIAKLSTVYYNYIITIYYHNTNYLFKVKRLLLIISDMFCTWIYFSIENVHHYTILRNL